MARLPKVLLLDVVPALVVAAYAFGIGLSQWCRSHYAHACEDLTRMLTGPSMTAIATGWLVLAFAAGMTTATIVRRAFLPAGVKAPSRFLILAGIIAVPAVGYVFYATPGGSSGWGPLVAVMIAAFSSVVIVAWLGGYFANRLAFTQADTTASNANSPRIEADGAVLLILLHALFAVMVFVAAQDLAAASAHRINSRWAESEFMLVTFILGFPWDYGLLLALPGSGMGIERMSGGAWFMWLGVAVNYALLAWISVRAFLARGGRSAVADAQARFDLPLVVRLLKVSACDIAPVIIGVLAFVAIYSTQACARGDYEICERYLDRWKVRSDVMKIALWLVVAFSAGMVTATIGRRWWPARLRVPDRFLKWIGLVLVVFMGVAALGLPSSGPIPVLAVVIMALVAILLGTWRLGLAANRAAFRNSRA